MASWKAKGGWEKKKERKETSQKIETEKAKLLKLTNWFEKRQGQQRNPPNEPEPEVEPEQEFPTVHQASLPSILPYPHDVGKWEALGKVSTAMKEYFTTEGIFKKCQHFKHDFTDSERMFAGDLYPRRCTKDLFFTKHANGEVIKRQWLCYSPKTKSLYCSYCCLFLPNDKREAMDDKLVFGGFNEWKNAQRSLLRHERVDRNTNKAPEHREAIRAFIVFASGKCRIDRSIAEQAENETTYWREVLRRLISVIKFLSSRGLAFRGDDEIIGSPHNGNYLGTLELLAEYDPFLQEHIRRYGNKGRGKVSYLSSTICDEFIGVLGRAVYDEITQEIKTARYFSISADSTPDISHSDQLAITVRYVLNGKPIERFLQYEPIHEHTGESLAAVILKFLEDNDIDIKYCRGQSYDNASNMSGIYNGVQAHIKEKNPLAEYIPCCGHSLNLIGQSAVDCCSTATRYFAFVQALYVFLSASTHRWGLMVSALNKIKAPVPKRLSDTRWSAHFHAVAALKKGYKALEQTLQDMVDNPKEKTATRLEAEGLLKSFVKLETAIMTEVWYVILGRYQATSEFLQCQNMDLFRATEMLSSLVSFTESLRDSFSRFEDSAKELSGAETYNTETGRRKKRNRRYDDGEAEDATETMSPSDLFRTETYLVILDQLQSALRKRLSAYNELADRFGFLTRLDSLNPPELNKYASKLAQTYCDDLSDRTGDQLVQFAALYRDTIPPDARVETLDRPKRDKKVHATATEDSKSPGHSKIQAMMDMFYDKVSGEGLRSTFPDVEIILRMYMCLMVTNCSGERSFSTLKRIKNHLRSTMSQSRLNSLAIICIEHEVLETIGTDQIINDFAFRKARNVPL